MNDRKAEAQARGVALGGLAAACLRIFTEKDIVITLGPITVWDGKK